MLKTDVGTYHDINHQNARNSARLKHRSHNRITQFSQNAHQCRLGEDVQRSLNNNVELLRSAWGLLPANRQGDTGQIGLCQRYWQAEGGMTDPAMALLNHVMKCAYCYPQSGKYCLYGSKLHKESNPSVDNKLVRVKNER